MRFKLRAIFMATNLALLSAAPAAQAASFVIVDGQTVTSQQTLTAGETGVIETGGSLETAPTAISSSGTGVSVDNSGSISTTGVNAFGISSAGADAIITNSGSIDTDGDGGLGISSAGADAIITNSGRIKTKGGGIAFGIWSAGDNTTITNSGSIDTTVRGILSDGANDIITNSGIIITTGVNAFGIMSSGTGANATITNSGSISTNGFEAYGIYSTGVNATITNSGSTITNGGNAHGIRSNGVNATITNSGSISTNGVNAHGIWSEGDSATITNSGSISTPTGYGIFSEGDNAIITNSGLVQSSNFEAILGGVGTQTLNLLPGSRILGTIDLSGGNDTANVYGSNGSAVLTFVNTETINIYTDNAVLVGNSVVVVDPTLESSRGVGLSTLSSGIHNVISQRMQHTPTFAPVKVAALKLSPGMLYQERTPISWVKVFGSKTRRGTDRQVLGYDHDYTGLLGGYEQDYQRGRLGVVVGVTKADTNASETSIDSDSIFAGVYGHFYFDRVNVTASLIAGTESHDNRRRVLDNVLGYETAKSDNDSYFISPSVTVSSAYVLNPEWELRPSATATYSMGRYDSYRESGTTNANLDIDARTARAISARLQLEVARKIEQGEVNLRVGVQRRHTNDGAVNASLGGSDFRFSTAGDDTVTGSFVGLGTELNMKDRLSLVADIEYGELSGDETQLSGQVSLQYQF